MDLSVPVVLTAWGLLSVAASLVAGAWLAALDATSAEVPATDEPLLADPPAAA